ncbi:flagellar basal-body rod protein FlgC [Thermosipho africanus H17ap60334]|jgi:flagellar basal-body rod protein FlgC|uniref:Flagellar basal-body rod protein FlgC n=2 Tax=Thermosipho TaxID=2420 RepID=A0A841GQC3_9BACT|nr:MULTISPECIES: flagellar basal body rod protein FlgC [Thermosipho]ACJ75874.1 flagellar basal-body rod protein FlgC [Thermosipho africanus TCF52B]EKF49884.1 flagellar basal-body rod protein FlgC [Thermosipho africanus H17ap60334]MBB6062023.1 flagellar basal-body rod protein FlgC [Thermosipho japonicus]MBZ4650089.1 flgC [Thermosipho sp. (in: thermotogales)]MDK2838937.1 flagellar basal-body rod protein FlgC [Thermosipho sp. (in: thermotogales)]
MNEFNIMTISATGMSAQRLRIDVISNNLANSETTRTENGEPYRRKVPVFQELLRNINGRLENGGVVVKKIYEDKSPFRIVYDPTHPDADENGYVKLPNVNVVREMVDMINAQRAYEANVTAFNTTKAMINSALQIGR